MLKINEDVVEQIKKIAQSRLPNEACGYLAGKNKIITRCYELTNTDHSPEHFSFDPNEQFETIKVARSEGLEIIANFHSHPETLARPSTEDIKLAFDPNIFYGIISFKNDVGELNFFKIKEGKVDLIKHTIN